MGARKKVERASEQADRLHDTGTDNHQQCPRRYETKAPHHSCEIGRVERPVGNDAGDAEATEPDRCSRMVRHIKRNAKQWPPHRLRMSSKPPGRERQQ
jgi:hypothetical protein